jgi:hypothetical protein
MAADSTFAPIATTTLGSAVTGYTFSSIPSTYTDLIIVVANFGMSNAGSALRMRFNGSSASDYSNTFVLGQGSAASSNRESGVTSIRVGGLAIGPATSNADIIIINIQNYSNTNTYKTSLIRDSSPNNEVGALVGLWRQTSAISSVSLISYNGTHTLNAGTTLTLYGIAAA